MSNNTHNSGVNVAVSKRENLDKIRNYIGHSAFHQNWILHRLRNTGKSDYKYQSYRKG